MTQSTLPPMLSFEPPSTFAAFTLRERLPKIVGDVARQAGWSEEARARLNALAATLPDGYSPAVLGSTPAENATWSSLLGDLRGRAWRELPFFYAEFVLYRAILDAIRDARPARDPFADKKLPALARAAESLREVALASTQGWVPEDWDTAIGWSLHGNAGDLSQLQVQDTQRTNRRAPLVNDLSAFEGYLAKVRPTTLDIALDNVGDELIGDLALTEFVLRTLPSVRVRLHAKDVPMFVSDATVADVEQTITALRGDGEPAISSWATQLDAYRHTGRLTLHEDSFWSQPLCFHELTPRLRSLLADSDVLVLKGDLNYRRYVQDRSWPLDSPTSPRRIPALPPTLALRVLKSEVAVGLPSDLVRQLAESEPDFLFSGGHSVIQWFD